MNYGGTKLIVSIILGIAVQEVLPENFKTFNFGKIIFHERPGEFLNLVYR